MQATGMHIHAMSHSLSPGCAQVVEWGRPQAVKEACGRERTAGRAA